MTVVQEGAAIITCWQMANPIMWPAAMLGYGQRQRPTFELEVRFSGTGWSEDIVCYVDEKPFDLPFTAIQVVTSP